MPELYRKIHSTSDLINAANRANEANRSLQVVVREDESGQKIVKLRLTDPKTGGAQSDNASIKEAFLTLVDNESHQSPRILKKSPTSLYSKYSHIDPADLRQVIQTIPLDAINKSSSRFIQHIISSIQQTDNARTLNNANSINDLFDAARISKERGENLVVTVDKTNRTVQYRLAIPPETKSNDATLKEALLILAEKDCFHAIKANPNDPKLSLQGNDIHPIDFYTFIQAANAEQKTASDDATVPANKPDFMQSVVTQFITLRSIAKMLREEVPQKIDPVARMKRVNQKFVDAAAAFKEGANEKDSPEKRKESSTRKAATQFRAFANRPKTAASFMARCEAMPLNAAMQKLVARRGLEHNINQWGPEEACSDTKKMILRVFEEDSPYFSSSNFDLTQELFRQAIDMRQSNKLEKLRGLRDLEGKLEQWDTNNKYPAAKSEILRAFFSDSTSLNLSNYGLDSIPPLENLTALTELDLSSNEIKGSKLKALGQCPQLKKLELDNNPIETLSSLPPLSQLTHLKLNNSHQLCSLNSLPTLENLKDLGIKGSSVMSLPAKLGSKAPQLEHLDIFGALVFSVPKDISLPKNVCIVSSLTAGYQCLTREAVDNIRKNTVDDDPKRHQLPKDDCLRPWNYEEFNRIASDRGLSTDQIKKSTAEVRAQQQKTRTQLEKELSQWDANNEYPEVKAKIMRAFESDSISLDLSGCSLKSVPPLGILKRLTHLNLSSNEIKEIESLGELKWLTQLDLSSNKIEEIKPLRALKELTHLNLSSNEIKEIKPLGALKGLTHLDLSSNTIASSALEGIKSCECLQKLLLDNNTAITNLNSLPISLQQLRYLSLRNNTSLPSNALSTLPSLKSLTTLDARGTNIQRLQHGDNYPKLKYLFGLGISLIEAPGKYSDSEELMLLDEQLQQWDLYNRHPKTKAAVIQAYKTDSKSLDLSGHNFDTVPPLGILKRLTHLDLSSNTELLHLKNLEQCERLKELNLDNNALFSLEELPSSLQELKSLSLRDSKQLLILELPALQQLEFIDITGTKIVHIPRECIDGLPELLFLRGVTSMQLDWSDAAAREKIMAGVIVDKDDTAAQMAEKYTAHTPPSYREELQHRVKKYSNPETIKLSQELQKWDPTGIHPKTRAVILKAYRDQSENLDLSNCNVTEIPPLGMLHITHLNLAENPITDLSPLKECKHLVDLNLNNTNLPSATSLPVSLQSLQSLSLACNSDLRSLHGLSLLKNIKTIDVRGCPIEHTQASLKKLSPSRPPR